MCINGLHTGCLYRLHSPFDCSDGPTKEDKKGGGGSGEQANSLYADHCSMGGNGGMLWLEEQVKDEWVKVCHYTQLAATV